MGSIKAELIKVDEYLWDCFKDDYPEIRKRYLYFLNTGGKRIRPVFTLLAARYGTGKTASAVPLAAAFELFHAAALIHDDILDKSIYRRDNATMNSLYGNDFALHIGDCLMSKALSIVAQYKNKRIDRMVSKACLAMCAGELRQLETAFDYKQNLRQYFYRIKRKTALLFAVSCQAGAASAQADNETVNCLGLFGYYVGMAYQISDDVLDYSIDNKTLGKPAGNDIAQGVVTLPLIYALSQNNGQQWDRLVRLLAQKPFQQERVNEIIHIVVASGGTNYALKLANKYVGKAVEQLSRLPVNTTGDVLRKIAMFVYDRSS